MERDRVNSTIYIHAVRVTKAAFLPPLLFLGVFSRREKGDNIWKQVVAPSIFYPFLETLRPERRFHSVSHELIKTHGDAARCHPDPRQ